jgi:hypothetical protein
MIYAIADLHLDATKNKPMDIFGIEWENHEQKIFQNWIKNVRNDDLVLIPGDISWALKLEEAKVDLMKINDLPGQKVLIKGNHDYWWNSVAKLNSLGLNTLHFLKNDSYLYQGIAVAGTRAWSSKDSELFTEDDLKIYNRELMRLENSLKTIPNSAKFKIAMLHYPPFDLNLKPNDFFEIMKKYSVDICVYGHLHSQGHKLAVEGDINGIVCHLVSSDYLDFKLKKIWSDDNEANS